jgi:hypothetical protein
MIDFEQEIETRLALFQQLTGKGNIKDGNRTLYEIVRLMLGMINQNGAGMAFMQQLQPAVAPDASPSREAPPGYSIQVASLPVASETPETVAITEDALEHPASAPLASDPVDAPYGYTRHGHPRLTPMPAPLGYTEAGNIRRGPRPNRKS